MRRFRRTQQLTFRRLTQCLRRRHLLHHLPENWPEGYPGIHGRRMAWTVTEQGPWCRFQIRSKGRQYHQDQGRFREGRTWPHRRLLARQDILHPWKQAFRKGRCKSSLHHELSHPDSITGEDSDHRSHSPRPDPQDCPSS